MSMPILPISQTNIINKGPVKQHIKKFTNMNTTKKITKFKAVITKAKKETDDTWTLQLFRGDKKNDYSAGQFITIDPHEIPELSDIITYFEHVKGKKEQVRAYSLSSAPHEENLMITIKPEIFNKDIDDMPPILSKFLASDILVGKEILVSGFAGAYVMPQELIFDSQKVVHLVAGSGIVPSFSIIKDELINNKNNHLKHELIFVNKTLKDIIFHDELKDLMAKFPSRFTCHFFLTRDKTAQEQKGNYYFGRPDQNKIEHIFGDTKKLILFACGPALNKWQRQKLLALNKPLTPRFMEWVFDLVNKLNIEHKRFKKEIYG